MNNDIQRDNNFGDIRKSYTTIFFHMVLIFIHTICHYFTEYEENIYDARSNLDCHACLKSKTPAA